MFKMFSWMLTFASCMIFIACEKNPVESADAIRKQPAVVEAATPRFGVSAKEIGETQLSFIAVPSQDVMLYNVTITNSLGKSIIYKMGGDLCSSGQRVPLQHAGESYAKQEGLYKLEFQGRVPEGRAFTATERYFQQ